MKTILIAAVLALCSGCGASDIPAEVASVTSEVSEKLARCRAVARTTYFVDKRGLDQALADYEACKRKEGVQ